MVWTDRMGQTSEVQRGMGEGSFRALLDCLGEGENGPRECWDSEWDNQVHGGKNKIRASICRVLGQGLMGI